MCLSTINRVIEKQQCENYLVFFTHQQFANYNNVLDMKSFSIVIYNVNVALICLRGTKDIYTIFVQVSLNALWFAGNKFCVDCCAMFSNLKLVGAKTSNKSSKQP